MPTRRALIRGSSRIAVGLVALAVAAVGMITVTGASLPGHTNALPAVTVDPVPNAPQRVCPGPLLTLAADSSKATVASAFGSPDTVRAAKAGDTLPAVTGIDAPDASSANRFGVPEILSVPAGAVGGKAPLIAGSQSQTAALDDLTGLATAACTQATGDSWLVAGATNLGETTLLLLSNPSSVAATVDLTVYGHEGVVAAPGASGITLQPHTQHVIALAGLAPDEPAPVVHVQSSGGRVAAALEQSLIRGLDPGGIEIAGPTSGPGTHQVIGGVAVTTLAALKAGNSSEGYAEALPAVRVLVPGAKPAQVSVGAVNENGKPAGTSAAVTVQPGVPTEIALPNLSDGSYTLTLDSDQPFVAAARTSTTSDAGRDFAWFVASAPFTHDFLIAVAPGPSPRLHLVNMSATDATVTLVRHREKTLDDHGQSVTLAAGTAKNIQVASGADYTLTGSSSLLASISYSSDGLLSAYALNPHGQLADPITVYPR